LVTSLLILAIVSTAVGLAGGAIILGAAALEGGLDRPAVLWALASFAAGCFAGGTLWAFAWLCGAQQRLALTQGRIATALERFSGAGASLPVAALERSEADGVEPAASAQAPARRAEQAGSVDEPTAPPDRQLQAILAELRELNLNLLLSDAQRQLKRQHFVQRQERRLRERFEHALGGGDLAEAESALDRFARAIPDSAELAGMRQRLEEARSAAESRDLAQAQRQAEDLMAVGEFEQAAAVAEKLLARHPGSTGAIALVARVRREREAYVTEHRQRLYRKVEVEAGARRWRAALKAAEELLEAYPAGPEAESVRSQMETLRSNARIEEARELRDRILEMINRRRFSEALELARDLVGRFPDTAAAAELTRQMARLEELADAERTGR